MSSTGLPDVEHDLGQHYFWLEQDGQRAQLDYRLEDRLLTITHTNVPTVIGGRGIAAALVEAALTFARAQDYKVVPECTYAGAYFRRHPEWQALLA